MPRPPAPTPLDPFQDLLAADFEPKRLQHNLAAFRDVLTEIAKLRKLDLTDIHPAIVFDPSAPYREEPKHE